MATTVLRSQTTKDYRPVTIRFPAEVLDALRASAAAHLRSLNAEIVYALRTYVQESTQT